MTKEYQSFAQFYPFYLNQHSQLMTRKLHYIGSTLVLVCLFSALITASFGIFLMLPVLGYGFAWVGHFFVEKNRPATFTYPLYSFVADYVMLFQAVTGKLDHSYFD
ncbi:hypothetical protein SIN8267_00752 [Sinobacterium norvegicum]|uniref:DUF962 domain-containing protein n=1 Tax=Sinobacterium norvegicum TaxID=1641715 RepID=A0ABM9ABT6_9GAMM|nr:DUF962 domain-containing protein [Sinobacterium norvegicum]CAH0990658.1 hypothetical protein SIN8267_00752 [Sinobacterium norvegicum]